MLNMNTKKKKKFPIILISVSILVLFLAACAVYYFEFTPEGYRMSVPYRSSFEEVSDNVYFNKNYSGDTKAVLQMIDNAKDRNKTFWGDLQFEDNSIIIVCDDNNLISKLGGDHDTQTLFFPSKKNYISVSNEYCDINIFAHELTHAELHTRLTVNALNSIPTWFDEGLALQNDYREQYSSDAWKDQTENGKNVISVEDMNTPSEFYAGTKEDRRFRYLNAKHEVSNWMDNHKQNGLLKLIDKLNNGSDFNSAYSQ